MLLTCLYDRISGTCHPIVCQPNLDCAKRTVTYTFSRDEFLSNHSDDFDLYVLGEFDERNASIALYDKSDVYPVRSLIPERTVQDG